MSKLTWKISLSAQKKDAFDMPELHRTRLLPEEAPPRSARDCRHFAVNGANMHHRYQGAFFEFVSQPKSAK